MRYTRDGKGVEVTNPATVKKLTDAGWVADKPAPKPEPAKPRTRKTK